MWKTAQLTTSFLSFVASCYFSSQLSVKCLRLIHPAVGYICKAVVLHKKQIFIQIISEICKLYLQFVKDLNSTEVVCVL